MKKVGINLLRRIIERLDLKELPGEPADLMFGDIVQPVYDISNDYEDILVESARLTTINQTTSVTPAAGKRMQLISLNVGLSIANGTVGGALYARFNAGTGMAQKQLWYEDLAYAATSYDHQCWHVPLYGVTGLPNQVFQVSNGAPTVGACISNYTLLYREV